MGTLYMVGTPIGNLEDTTLRALRILQSVSLVLAEDTRRARKLLKHFDIRVPLLSYHQHSTNRRSLSVLDALHNGDVALITDAGTPAISDPGVHLAMTARESGFSVTPIPGPSAITAALSVAGIGADQFIFLGFLPRTRRDRLNRLHSVASEQQTIVAFEAPHRLIPCLTDIYEVMGDRPIAVCRELTKLHEEVFYGFLSEAISHFSEPRGEFVLVMSGSKSNEPPGVDLGLIERELVSLKAQGLTRRDALKQIMTDHRISRREAYQLWLSLVKPELKP